MFTRRHFLTIAGAATIAAPSAARAFEVDRSTPFGGKLIQVADPFEPPNLPLLRPDGAVTRMTAYPGEVVLATFWATWCHVCHYEMPVIDSIHAELSAEGVRVLPMSLDAGDDAMAKVSGYFESRKLANLDVLIDADRLNAGALGIRGTPTSFIIDPNGRVVGAVEGRGYFDSDEARRYLRHVATL